MMEQVRLCTVWPMENWLGSSLNQTTVLESDSCALEQGYLRIEKEGNLAIGPCECGSIIAFQSHTKAASRIDRMTLQNHTLAAPIRILYVVPGPRRARQGENLHSIT